MPKVNSSSFNHRGKVVAICHYRITVFDTGMNKKTPKIFLVFRLFIMYEILIFILVNYLFNSYNNESI